MLVLLALGACVDVPEKDAHQADSPRTDTAWDTAGTDTSTPCTPVDWYLDADGDGWGTTATTACEAPPGYAADAGDCDDADPDVHPDAPETCDGTDDDCYGAIDDDPVWG